MNYNERRSKQWMRVLYDVDLVDAKSGRKLNWWGRTINRGANVMLTLLTYAGVLAFLIFVCYLAVKMIIFLINV